MVKPKLPTHLKSFAGYLADFKWVLLAFIVLATTPKIADWYLNIGPPWPDRSKVANWTAVFLALPLLAAYAHWRGIGLSKLKRRVAICVIATAIVAAVFLLLSAFFVVDAPTSANQVAKGFWLTDEWQQILETGKFPDGQPYPISGVRSLLQGREWHSEELYPAWQVYLVNWCLLISWALFFGFFAASISTFILLLQKQADNKRLSAQASPGQERSVSC